MILIINNDKRMNYLSEYIRDSGMDLIQYHLDSSSFDFHILKETHYLILPFGGIAEDGRIASTHLYLTEDVLRHLRNTAIQAGRPGKILQPDISVRKTYL